MIKKRQLKIFLLKENIQNITEPIREDADSTEFPLKKNLDWEGKFFLKKSTPRTPSWVDFISPSLEDKLDEVMTQTSGAVLLIKERNRLFAFTFGYGRTLLRPDCFERNFGLRVVLNTVNPEQIRSIDMRTMEEMTLLTRRQASRVSDFGVFGLDSSQDLLRGVTGIPRDISFASRISGADAVTLAKEIDIEKVNQICGHLYDAYNSNIYKKRFSFIDYLRLERDPRKIQHLERSLIKDLEEGNSTRMHLAPPEPEDWQNIEGFTYSQGSNARVYPDLEINDLLQELSPRTGFSINYLRNKYIGVRYRESDESVMKYHVFSCLVYETELDGYLYVLSSGDWHQIDKDWSESVRRKVEEIPLSDVPLPPSSPEEKEGDYNKRVAESNGWALMDKQI
ncbi:MAG: TIGR04141 family sporadically distributed protein, partial [Promethearchaeota archaeon]